MLAPSSFACIAVLMSAAMVLPGEALSPESWRRKLYQFVCKVRRLSENSSLAISFLHRAKRPSA
jgi:hypothetical protein